MLPNLSQLLKKMHCLNLDNWGSPEALIRTVWYFLTMHLGMRGRDEDWKPRYGDLSLKVDENGEYTFRKGN